MIFNFGSLFIVKASSTVGPLCGWPYSSLKIMQCTGQLTPCLDTLSILTLLASPFLVAKLQYFISVKTLSFDSLT